MNPSSTAIPGFPARGLSSASIHRPKLSPSLPITALNGKAKRPDEGPGISLLRPPGPRLRRHASDFQPGWSEDLGFRPVPRLRRPDSFPYHLHLWRRFHRGLRLRRLAPRHLDWLLLFRAALFDGPVYRLASARSRVAPSGSVSHRFYLRAAPRNRKSHRLLVR